jgi:hypothetical protein
LLADLPPGLAAPRCLGVETYPGDETWLWLEDVTETGPKAWPLDRYGLAAQHLGRFNGQYLTGKPLPTMPWLANSHIRQRIVDAEATIAELPQTSQSPVFADLLAEDSLERMLTLWAARELLLARLNHLPQTLCHFDAFRRNLLNRPGPTGAAETVAIDWALTGPGVIGQELVALFHTSLTFTTFDLDQIPTLDQLIFQGYLAGLRESGWLGDPRLARFGFAASAALDMVANRAIKYPNVARRVAALPPEAELPRLLNPGGPAQYRAAERHLLALGDEAVSLLEVL